MSFKKNQRSTDTSRSTGQSTVHNSPATESATEQSTPHRSEMGRKWRSKARAEQHFGMRIPDESTLQRLERNEQKYGRDTHEWIAEGMPAEIMGNPKKMEAFRQRQSERSAEVPANIERQNKRSVLRSEKAAGDTSTADETGVPEPVRDVISSRGQSLDPSIQRAMEDRMGDSFGDVRVHTGPTAAEACESINARAFTVGNHIAFNSGEYDPSTPEGQHVLAHELVHVRQQTEGAVSMLPQEEMELEVDPDPALEREAEETAQQVMEGGELGIQRLADTKVHIQRVKSVEQLQDEITNEQQNRVNTIVEQTNDFNTAEEFLSQLAGQLTGLNHKLSRKGKLKDEVKIGLEDIEIIIHRDGDRPHYLLNTNKWGENIELTGDGMSDFKHISARHGHPDAKGDWPVPPGTETESIEYEAFPASMTPEDIKSIIELTVSQGRIGGNSGELIYDGAELDSYGINRVHIRRNPKSGEIQTAFPVGDE